MTNKKINIIRSNVQDLGIVEQNELYVSSVEHINDVKLGLQFFKELIDRASKMHDYDKIFDIDNFYYAFIKKFEDPTWLIRHKKLNRHHLLDPNGVPPDVNLIDVLEYLVDCVVAGLARKGKIEYSIEIDDKVLQLAFKNTVDLLIENVELEEEC